MTPKRSPQERPRHRPGEARVRGVWCSLKPKRAYGSAVVAGRSPPARHAVQPHALFCLRKKCVHEPQQACVVYAVQRVRVQQSSPLNARCRAAAGGNAAVRAAPSCCSGMRPASPNAARKRARKKQGEADASAMVKSCWHVRSRYAQSSNAAATLHLSGNVATRATSRRNG